MNNAADSKFKKQTVENDTDLTDLKVALRLAGIEYPSPDDFLTSTRNFIKESSERIAHGDEVRFEDLPALLPIPGPIFCDEVGNTYLCEGTSSGIIAKPFSPQNLQDIRTVLNTGGFGQIPIPSTAIENDESRVGGEGDRDEDKGNWDKDTADDVVQQFNELSPFIGNFSADLLGGNTNNAVLGLLQGILDKEILEELPPELQKILEPQNFNLLTQGFHTGWDMLRGKPFDINQLSDLGGAALE